MGGLVCVGSGSGACLYCLCISGICYNRLLLLHSILVVLSQNRTLIEPIYIIYIYIYIYIYTHIYIYMYILCVRARVCKCVFVYTCMCIYTSRMPLPQDGLASARQPGRLVSAQLTKPQMSNGGSPAFSLGSGEGRRGVRSVRTQEKARSLTQFAYKTWSRKTRVSPSKVKMAHTAMQVRRRGHPHRAGQRFRWGLAKGDAQRVRRCTGVR